MEKAHGMRPLALMLGLGLILALLGVYTLAISSGAPPSEAAPTIPAYLPMIVLANTPAPPTATVPPGARPDLLIARMAIELEHSGCYMPGSNLGLSVLVENAGLAPAGGFVVKINGQPQQVDTGLAPGARISIWVPSYVAAGENVAIADATNLVSESNEHNNQASARLPIPTPPPACPTLTPPPR